MSDVTVVSFDIDGTLEVGEPAGVVPVALVRMARALGYVIGSCSDRPISYQQDMWETLRIVPDFTVDAYGERLAALHSYIEVHGPFVAHAQRVLIEARRAS